MKNVIILIVTLSVTALLSKAQDAKTVIDNSLKSLGATDLKTLEYSGSGYSFAFGQSPNPNMPWPKFNAKSYTKGINYELGASTQRLVRTQAENPPRGGGMQPVIGEQTQNQVIDSSSPWTGRVQIWITPYGFLKAALANSATVKSIKEGGKKFSLVSFMAESKYTLNGYLNDQGQVEKVETWVDNAVLGDVLIEVSYSEYKDFNGLKFPTRILQKDGGYPVYDLTITDVKGNAEVTIQPNPAPSAAPVVAAEKVAEGVYYVAGGGATASIAVEFKDFVTVLEAPLSEGRSLAVIEEVKKLIPNKPIKYLVNTHHHFDHSSGLRTYVAEGAIIVTHEVNKSFYQKTFKSPHKLNPDKLELSNKKAVIESFTDKKTITDGVRTIELYHIAGNLHNDGIIMMYFPQEKMLAVCDMFPRIPADAPVPQPSAFTVNLVENLDRLKLDFDVILPFHGTVTNKAELMRVSGRSN